MIAPASPAAENVEAPAGTRWWELEVCCAPERQISMLERLLPPGFAFYVREPNVGDVGVVRAFVPEERTSADRFAAGLFSLAMEAPKGGAEPPKIGWRLVDSWTLPDSIKREWSAQEVGERLLVLPEWEA